MSKGFTLIELLVVTGIITLMTVLILSNYRTGDQELALQISASKLAQNLRRAQGMAISAKKFQGEVPMGGYGIYFNTSDATSYILFADRDDGNDYDAGETLETIDFEKNTSLKALSPSGPLTIIFSAPDPTVYFFPDSAAVSITIEAEKLRGQASQYTYQRVSCGFFGYCMGWFTPRASCDISQSAIECPNPSFSAQASDPQTVYDQFNTGFNFSYKYQKQEIQTTTYAEKTVEINKAGLIAIK